MTLKTPPAAWDRHALEVARGIASLDRAKIPPAQFVSIIQSALVDAMMMACFANSTGVEDALAALANLDKSRAMVRDLRQMGIETYPREIVEQLFNAIEQLIEFGQSAITGEFKPNQEAAC